MLKKVRLTISLLMCLLLSQILIVTASDVIDYNQFPYAVDIAELPKISIYSGEGINNINEIKLDFLDVNNGVVTFSIWGVGADQTNYPRRDYMFHFSLHQVATETYTTFNVTGTSVFDNRQVKVNTMLRIDAPINGDSDFHLLPDLKRPLYLFHNKYGSISLMTPPYYGNLPSDLQEAKDERLLDQ